MLTAGQIFARYVIEAPIGQGGMGEVYRAYDEKLRRKVALKVIHPDLAVPDAAARLVREARAAAALTHPNTIAIHDLGEIDGNVFLVMELVSGAPLRAYVGDTEVPVAQKLRWLVDIARGLAAAHKAGLVHRDVKPTNVMVSDDGVVKVLDFGLAKPVEAASFRTDAGLVVGTPRYMAPELSTGMPADARSDQYAFGVTAYELLAGAHPGSPMGAVPAALDSRVPEVGPAVARIIARTLSRAAGDRFATMSEVASALEEHVGATRASAVVAAEPSPPTRREAGRDPPRDAAMALAPTELQPSDVGLRATAPLGLALEPADRGVSRIAIVVGVLAAAGAVYGASRLVGERVSAEPDAAAALVDAAADGTGGDGAAATGALDAEPDALGEAVAVADAASALDAGGDAELDAPADAATDAVPERARPPVSVDEFQDPWAKPSPR